MATRSSVRQQQARALRVRLFRHPHAVQLARSVQQRPRADARAHAQLRKRGQRLIRQGMLKFSFKPTCCAQWELCTCRKHLHAASGHKQLLHASLHKAVIELLHG